MTRSSLLLQFAAKRITLRLGALVVVAVLSIATPTLAGGFLDTSAPKENVKPTWAAPAKRQPVEGHGEDALVAELKNAEMRVREAQQNAETAEWAYKRARTRRYPRGEALQEIKDRAKEMNNERSEAEREFTALVSKARQSGMPVGALSDYLDLADDIERGQSQRVSAQ